MNDGPFDGFARYAIYWAPEPGSPLARFGAAWLGHDPAGDEPGPAPEVAALPRPREALVARARRYGLHATLKAPFRLAEGATAAALADRVAALAARLAAAEGPGLALDGAFGFLTLRPAGPAPVIDAVAAACVTELDDLRAALTEAELADRRKAGLTAAEDAHLVRWGYPHVLDQFQLHVTLTGMLPPAEMGAAQAALAPWLAPLLAPRFRLDALSLFGDPGGGAAFRLLRRWPLSGS